MSQAVGAGGIPGGVGGPSNYMPLGGPGIDRRQSQLNLESSRQGASGSSPLHHGIPGAPQVQ